MLPDHYTGSLMTFNRERWQINQRVASVNPRNQTARNRVFIPGRYIGRCVYPWLLQKISSSGGMALADDEGESY